ncbi:phosphoadenosine phosphosulfate reductase family protein [Bacillota bacterium Meth-B3]
MTTPKIIIVNVSGGVDSTACYLLAMERGDPFRAVFADTGNEHEITLDYVRSLAAKTGGPEVRVIRADYRQRMMVRRMGLEAMIESGDYKRGWTRADVERVLESLHPTGNPFLDMCMTKGRFPSTKARFCTQELKMEVLNHQAIAPAISEAIGSGGIARDVVSWVGVRRDESTARADALEWETGPMGNTIYRPLVDWNKLQCFELLKRHGVEPNPLYRMGCARVGCMPCLNARKEEIREISKRFPGGIDRIRHWETMVSACSKRRDGATFFSADKTPGEGDGRSHIDAVVEWSKTGRGGRQLDVLHMTDEPLSCMSAYGLCE